MQKKIEDSDLYSCEQDMNRSALLYIEFAHKKGLNDQTESGELLCKRFKASPVRCVDSTDSLKLNVA